MPHTLQGEFFSVIGGHNLLHVGQFLFNTEVSDYSDYTWIKIIKDYIYFIFSLLSCQMFFTIIIDISQ
jgi:hypothetical protein